MTASWEKGLDGITRGTVIMEDYREKLEDFIRKRDIKHGGTESDVTACGTDPASDWERCKRDRAEEKLGIACPVCGGELETTPFGYGCDNYKKKTAPAVAFFHRNDCRA